MCQANSYIHLLHGFHLGTMCIVIRSSWEAHRWDANCIIHLPRDLNKSMKFICFCYGEKITEKNQVTKYISQLTFDLTWNYVSLQATMEIIENVHISQFSHLMWVRSRTDLYVLHRSSKIFEERKIKSSLSHVSYFKVLSVCLFFERME
jgi:hypothetical protein